MQQNIATTFFKARALKALAFCALGTLGCACQSLTDLKSEDFETLSLPKDQVVLTVPPAELSEYDQMLIVRLSEILDRGARTPEERAQLFYELGIVYDRLGLEGSARTMFMNALIEKPDFVPAYDFIGIYLASHGYFQDAYDAFDSALELAGRQGVERVYTYFSRALALYYGNRAHNALDDMNLDYTMRQGDPYRILWFYLIEREALGEEQARLGLKNRLAAAVEFMFEEGQVEDGQEIFEPKTPDEKALFQIKSLEHFDKLKQADFKEIARGNFGIGLCLMMAGKISDDFIFSLIKDDEITQQERIEKACEAYFYLGKKALFEKRPVDAFWYFQLSLATGKYDFLECRYARVELDRLARHYQIKPFLNTSTMHGDGNGQE